MLDINNKIIRQYSRSRLVIICYINLLYYIKQTTTSDEKIDGRTNGQTGKRQTSRLFVET